MAFDLSIARLIGRLFAPWQRRRAVRAAEMDDLRPVTVITGASGGIGRALALELGAAGDELLLLGRDGAALAALAQEVRETGAGAGAEVHWLAFDLSAPDCAEQVADNLRDLGGYAARLVNNAGFGEQEMFAETDPALLDELLAVNIRALTLLTRRFLPEMVARGEGAVINMASVGGFAPAPYQSVYYASKAYVISFTEALAFELRGRGVYLAAVCPGPVKTAFHEKIKAKRALYLLLFGRMAPARVARSVHRALLMRHWAVVTPGLITPFLGAALRVIPDSLMAPFMGLLYKKW